jgi:hypothetical protein
MGQVEPAGQHLGGFFGAVLFEQGGRDRHRAYASAHRTPAVNLLRRAAGIPTA